ncbi:recombinase family protein [Leucothrix arctica]|uniref:recombinase family protein n=1 Tax=Leucothrix arctica TaxID=1481894 RepID=UPI001FEC6E6C|nr:recombinase family protein [Leucothrix arctica]
MLLVEYIRVSSLDQDSTTQLKRVQGAGCDKVFSDKQSGTTTKGREKLTLWYLIKV